MAEASYDDEYSSETDQPVIDDQGADTDLGGYSNPDGTVGYSNNTSREPEESGDYDASVGAALSVGLVGIEMGLAIGGGLAALEGMSGLGAGLKTAGEGVGFAAPFIELAHAIGEMW